jgi:hypothetical protein
MGGRSAVSAVSVCVLDSVRKRRLLRSGTTRIEELGGVPLVEMSEATQPEDEPELRLLPARRVPLEAEHRREAVALLAGLLLDVAARHRSLASDGQVVSSSRRSRTAGDVA